MRLDAIKSRTKSILKRENLFALGSLSSNKWVDRHKNMSRKGRKLITYLEVMK